MIGRSAANVISWRVGRDCLAKRSEMLTSEPLSSSVDAIDEEKRVKGRAVLA
jgi:hypothetical protein